MIQSNGVADYCYLDYFTVTGKIATASVDITSVLYATYYNSIPVQLPANVEAATVDGETSGTLTLNWRYATGDVIPGGTAVLLKAITADSYDLTYVANDPTTAPTGNLLHGSDVATTTTGGTKYYALQDGANSIGFYWMTDDGAAFESGAHKAWLALPAGGARFFTLDDETTSIESNLHETSTDGRYYNLNGQRIMQPSKGLYIVNGKKVVVK